MTDLPLISLSLLAPLLGIFIILPMRSSQIQIIRYIALLASLLPLAISIYIYATADFSATGLQYHYLEEYPWIPKLGITYKVGLDGISMPMYFLTALLTFLVCMFSWDIEHRMKEYFLFFLLLEIVLLGVFTALDLFLFYIFWEMVLIPMYFIINIWGGPRREYAAIKFFLYTFSASLFMLLGIMALYFNAGLNSFDLTEIATKTPEFSKTFQILVFAALFMGFVVKMPQVPVHTWLPDAHVEAPTAGSVLLAGVLLKMGSYGVLRISLPLLPEGARWFVPIMLVIGILSILYGALVCLAQRDLKRLVAYSSISHMGVVLLGIAIGAKGLAPTSASALCGAASLGLSGAVYMMFAHGFISGLLFMIVGAIQHSLGTRDIPKLGGLAMQMPKAGVIITVGSLASLGLPGMVQFVAEFMVFLATYQAFGFLFLLPVLTIVVTAGYYLWALKRAIFGPLVETAKGAHDIKWYEFWPMMALVVLIVVFGVLPATILNTVNISIGAIVGVGGMP